MTIVEQVSQVYFDSPYLDKLQQLTVIAGQPVDVRCIAVGGNPTPLIDVYLDWLNITRLFYIHRSFQLRRRTGSAESGMDTDAEVMAHGLRAMDVTTVLETRRFVARVRDHGLTLHCRSSTSLNVRSIISNVTLFVNCQYYHKFVIKHNVVICLLYTSPSPRD